LLLRHRLSPVLPHTLVYITPPLRVGKGLIGAIAAVFKAKFRLLVLAATLA